MDQDLHKYNIKNRPYVAFCSEVIEIRSAKVSYVVLECEITSLELPQVFSHSLILQQ